MMQVQLTVNGAAVTLNAPENTLLVQALREHLNLTGTHVGCDTAQCGACTVIMNGQAIKSCNVLLAQVAGSEITTIEGLATDAGLHPIQQKFLEHAALQCGICTPGLIVATKALLDRHPDPDETTIRYWLAGNLCRCTGYDKIIRAVQDAARSLAHPA